MAVKLSENDRKKKRIRKKVDAFMQVVQDFLRNKNGGNVPAEWSCSLLLLETYYEQLITLNEEIASLDSLVVDSRYGKVPTPLLACRDKASIRLESLMKEMALTFKSASKLEVIDVVTEESPLEKFAKNKIEKRNMN